MHSLPCAASGAEDGVCLALTQLSKELLDSGSASMQAGGCDSSDCLFCQYRSNSPFHLIAYAGKLTTLLRKRSPNGTTLSSLNSVVDKSTEQGAALMAATTGASTGKRARTLHSAASLPSQPPTTGPAGASASIAAGHEGHVAQPYNTFLHTCPSTCLGGTCSASRTPHRAAAPSAPPHATASGASGCVQEPSRRPDVDADKLVADGVPLTEGPAKSEAGGSADGAVIGGATTTPADRTDQAPSCSDQLDAITVDVALDDRLDPGCIAGLGPSSMRLKQLGHRHDATSTQVPNPQHLPDRSIAGAIPHEQLLLPPLQQPRLLLGQPLPDGWTFQPEWERRPDPAPAELREVLCLPATGCPSRPGTRRRSRTDSESGGGGGSGGGTHGRQSCTGIVCALEFSPDGRLLAAGGVDKQIRLYNLSEAFGDLCDNDDDEGEDDQDGEDDGDRAHRSALFPELQTSRRSQDGAARARSCSLARSRRGEGGVDSDDDDCLGEEGSSAAGGRPLLAAMQRMPSKISSMAWSPYMDGVLTIGDYDGVILQLHIASGHQFADVEAHGGRKIWSVAHSTRIPHLVASAADDRCARLWAGRGLSHCIATLQPNARASVCGVDFSPGHDHVLALACSDRSAYLYDMRNLTGGPLATLRHHSRPASYCRFMGPDRLVTAATDASLALWDVRGAAPTLTAVLAAPQAPEAVPAHSAESLLAARASPFQVVQEYDFGQAGRHVDMTAGGQAACAGSAPGCGEAASACPNNAAAAASAAAPTTSTEPQRVFRGHRNEKNFVGLSVRAEDGLLACGSECSRAFAYHTSWTDPLASLDMPGCGAAWYAGLGGWGSGQAPMAGIAPPPVWTSARRSSSGSPGGSGFVSAVCWQPADAAAVLGLPPLLASASSFGMVSLSVLAARH